MVSLPEGSASNLDGPDAMPVVLTPPKSKRSQRKGQNRQGTGQWSANDIAVASLSDQFDGLCHSSTEATGATSSFPVISILQEFLQDSKTFRVPNQHSILQWHFEQHSVSSSSNQFRATVAFLLEGVPHHAAGAWHNSKAAAKRDAAERALGLFVSQWGSQLPQEEQMNQSDLSPDSRNMLQNLRNGQVNNAEVDDECLLMNFCLHFPPCQQSLPQLSASWEGDTCKGFAQISLFGVPHTFAGVPCTDECAARTDVVRRTLWYLQCPGFTNKFELDHESLAAGSGTIASPPTDWTVDDDNW